MYKFIRKTIPLGVAILLLAAGLFLVDVNNQAVASSAPADTCSASGAAARTFSAEVMAQLAAIPGGEKIDPILLERLQTEQAVEFYIILSEQADLSGAAALSGKVAKTTYVYEQLTRLAAKTQPDLLSYLDGRGLAYESMYIQNMIRVQAAGLAELEWFAARADVAKIDAPPEAQTEPVWKAMTPEERVEAVEWNIIRVHAPEAWAMGYRGEGYVVASNDTGVEYTHPALVGKYRGNLGSGNFDHNYNWWDGLGGYQYPYDYDGHGTHTTGTMVGDDGAGNQIGVAPGAQWIACAGIGGGDTDTLDCFQFFLTPWDLNGQNPDPSKAPHAINNSWYDPSGFDFRPIVQTLNAAGIVVVKSAGNAGPSCTTITNPGYVPEIIATAAFGQGDVIASFSSRGPTSNYGETILKPEVAAPGDGIRSSVPGGGYEGGWSGTSMAAPHTTALVALMWQAAPCIAGDVPLTKQIMMDTAEGVIDAQCPPFVDHPNDVWGWGILDDEAAVQAAMGYCGGSGYLNGTVSESAGLTPLEGVDITAERDDGYSRLATTDVSGYYTTTALFGTYTVTAELYGYYPDSVSNLVVITDMVTTQDFVLDPLPEYIISGTVTEVGSGIPLYAHITFDGSPVEVWTDPGTGLYQTPLPEGEYLMHVTADLHRSQSRPIVMDQDQTQNFELETLPCILLVDDDNDSPDTTPFYAAALDALGYEYDVFDTGGSDGPDLAGMQGYDMVFWFSGDTYGGSAGPNSTDEANLADYLDGGGKLFLDSQDYLYDMGLTTFGQTYLGVASFTSDSGNATTKYGVAGDPVGDGLGPYPLTYPVDFTDYGDIVNAGAGASVAFRSAASGGNPLDIDKDGGSWQTVFFGTSWVPIYNNNAANGQEALQRVIDFFGGCGVCEPVTGTSFNFYPLEPLTGEQVSFVGSATGSEPIAYEWDFDDGEIGSGAELTHTFALSGDYTVVLTATNACGADSFFDILTVLDPQDIGLSVEFFEVSLTPGEDGTAELLVSNTGDITLTFAITESPVVDWLAVDPTAGELLADESLTITLSVDAGALAPGEYNVALNVTSNDPDEPWISVPVELTVLDTPIEGLAASNDSPTMLAEVTTLSATLTAGTNVSFAWDFGDGEFGSGQVVTHTYAAAGVYTATVTASNPVSELSDTTVVTIIDEPAVYKVYLPLVFKNSTASLDPQGSLPGARLGRVDPIAW